MEKKAKVIRIIAALIVIIAVTLIVGGLTGKGDMTARLRQGEPKGSVILTDRDILVR